MDLRRIARDAVTDTGFALRAFRRVPGWTAMTLLTIALGVGASTAVFRVADTFLIRPLAYRDASRVHQLTLQGTLREESITIPLSAAVVREWRDGARTVEAMAAYDGQSGAYLQGDQGDVAVEAAIVDRTFIPFTGVRPLLGRNFTADEAAPNGPRAILLAEGFWRRQYGGSPDVLGKVVRIRRGLSGRTSSATIVGVMPASVFLPDLDAGRPDLWLPVVEHPEGAVRSVAVRLRPGVSADAARQELAGILDRVGAIDPRDMELHPQLRLTRPQDALPFRQALVLLTGAVVLLLLVACSNVSHLLLQRGMARERELAARHALGAHRGRLVRQLVTESLLLGAAGGALAMLVGWGTLEVVARLRPANLPALAHLTTGGVIPVAAGLSILTGLTVGSLGALHVAHDRLGLSLRTGTSSASPAHRRLRGALVVGQIALSTTLLAGAILLIGIVLDLKRVHLGFDARDLYAVDFRGRDLNELPKVEELDALASTIRDMGERHLGTRNVAVSVMATTGMDFSSAFESRERPGIIGPAGFTGLNFVTPEYFSVLRMPLVAGRPFDAGSRSRDEVIVNRTLARQLGNGGDVVGKAFHFRARRTNRPEPWWTVVGVVPDLLDNRLDRAPKPMLYHPYASEPGDAVGTNALVRLPGANAEEALRRFAGSVQPDPRSWRIVGLERKIEETLAEPRFTMTVLALFAASGVALAAIGLFGVLSYTLGLRTREIGVRITLGATRRGLVRVLLRDAMGQAALGTALGLAGAAGVAWVTRMSFYGVERIDAGTFAVAAGAMLGASLAACVGPLVRATRIDPAVAIRAE